MKKITIIFLILISISGCVQYPTADFEQADEDHMVSIINPNNDSSDIVSAPSKIENNIPSESDIHIVEPEEPNHSSSNESISKPNLNQISFKISDSKNNPIPNVYLRIDWDDPDGKGRTTFYSDDDGLIIYDFSKVGLGKHTIDIVEEYKIKKTIRYEITVEQLPAEYTLIWDFGNPNDIIIMPDSTATFYFKDKTGAPITGLLVCASYFDTRGNSEGLGFDTLEEIGELSNDGIVVWDNPPKDIDIEIQIEDSDKNLRLYNVSLSSAKGNTDYYFLW